MYHKSHYAKPLRNKRICEVNFIKRNRKSSQIKLELNQITDKKRFWKTIKPLLNNKCIQSSALTLINNENVISDDFKLA